MPLHIGRVDSQIETTSPAAETGAGPAAAAAPEGRGLAQVSDGELRRRLRPIVMAILEEELVTFQRRQG